MKNNTIFTKRRIALITAVFAMTVAGVILCGSLDFSSIKSDVFAATSSCNAVNDLRGSISANGTATVINLSKNCSYSVGLVDYQMFNNTISDQKLFADKVETIGPSKTITLSVGVPSCADQVDLFQGTLITDLSTGASYGNRLLASTRFDQTNFCKVSVPPVTASCSQAESQVTLGQSDTFTGHATGGTGSFTYAWLFSGNTTASGQTVSHTFGSVGSKSATVTVTSGGKTATAQCRLNVVAPVTPAINVSCSANPTTVNVGDDTTFTANATGGNGSFTYAWTVTDATSGTGQSIIRAFSSSGTKTAHVTVTSGTKTASADCSVAVNTPAPTQTTLTVTKSAASTVMQGDELDYTLTVTNTGSITANNVKVLDSLPANTSIISGNTDSACTASGQNIECDLSSLSAGSAHSFKIAVTVSSGASCGSTIYNEATAEADNASSVVSNQVSTSVECQNTQPTLAVSCSATESDIQVGDSVTYTGTATGGDGNYAYQWSGTDGLSSTNQAVSDTYNSTGSKTATVTVTDNGQVASNTCNVTVEEQQVNNNLNGSCSVSDSNPQIGETVTFSAEGTGGDGNYTYQWSGNNISSTNSQDVSTSYSYSGNQSATVVISDDGQSVTRTCTTDVQNNNNYNNNLGGSCYVSNSNVQIGQPVTFSAQGQGGDGNYTYQWSGLPNGYASGPNVTSYFQNIGQQYVTVTIYDNGQSVERNCNTNVYANNPIVYTNTPLPPPPPPNNPSYVYLSQVPYTGVGSTTKIVLFVLALAAWSAFVAYMIIRKRARKNLLKNQPSLASLKPAATERRNPALDAILNRTPKFRTYP